MRTLVLFVVGAVAGWLAARVGSLVRVHVKLSRLSRTPVPPSPGTVHLFPSPGQRREVRR